MTDMEEPVAEGGWRSTQVLCKVSLGRRVTSLHSRMGVVADEGEKSEEVGLITRHRF